MDTSGYETVEFTETGKSADSAAPWKVLVADDDKDMHAVVNQALAKLTVAGRPVQICHAYDGAEACRMLDQDHDIALVLLDLAMENQDAGLEAARTIRQTQGNQRVRIVVCSGNLAPALRAGISSLGFSECWPKAALTADKLAGIVKAAIASYAGGMQHH